MISRIMYSELNASFNKREGTKLGVMSTKWCSLCKQNVGKIRRIEIMRLFLDFHYIRSWLCRKGPVLNMQIMRRETQRRHRMLKMSNLSNKILSTRTLYKVERGIYDLNLNLIAPFPMTV